MQDTALTSEAINAATEAFYQTVISRHGEIERFAKQRVLNSRSGAYMEWYNRQMFGQLPGIPSLPQTVGQLAERLEAVCEAFDRHVERHRHQYTEGGPDWQTEDIHKRFDREGSQRDEAKDVARVAARAAMEAALQSLHQTQERETHRIVDLRDALPSTSLHAATAEHCGSPGAVCHERGATPS